MPLCAISLSAGRRPFHPPSYRVTPRTDVISFLDTPELANQGRRNTTEDGVVLLVRKPRWRHRGAIQDALNGFL